jgi:hypothetical protein
MKYWICDRPIVIAAPEVKPETTGWARKETRKPSWRKPAAI